MTPPQQRPSPREPGDLRARRRAWAWPGSWPQVSLALAHVLGACAGVIYRGRVRQGISSWVHRHRDVTHTGVALARGGAALDGLRIAFLSDVHAGNFLDEDDFLAICARVQQEAPDLICLGGDLVNLFDREILYLRKGLSLLQAPLGVVAVPGNHEYEEAREPWLWRSVLAELGIEVLLNRGKRIERGGASLWLCGVDDLLAGDPDLERALEGRSPGEPIVLLSHNPDFFEEAADVGVDLQLSGHTHGGQILLFGRTPLRHTRFGYWSGRFERDGAQLFVGRGIGFSLIPFRVGARAEIALIRLAVG